MSVDSATCTSAYRPQRWQGNRSYERCDILFSFFCLDYIDRGVMDSRLRRKTFFAECFKLMKGKAIKGSE